MARDTKVSSIRKCIDGDVGEKMGYKNGYNKGYDKGRSDAFKVVIFFTLYSCSIVGIVKVLLLL